MAVTLDEGRSLVRFPIWRRVTEHDAGSYSFTGPKNPYFLHFGRLMNPATLERLRAADDATQYEAPMHFDRRKALEVVRALKPKIEDLLMRSLELDHQIQDASFFADLAVRRESTKPDILETALVIRFSAFGNLFTFYQLCGGKAYFPAETIAQLIELVEREGLHYVNSESLNEPYSGIHPHFAGHRWWDRFFAYN